MALSLTHKAFKLLIRAFEKLLKVVSQQFYLKVATSLVNEIDLIATIPTKKGPLYIKCTSETVRIRAREMLRREPDTLEWIETFEPDDVFWDVGSNIGVFTLYAGIVASTRVVAFDPLPHNYATLAQNIAINGLTEKVMLFCIAVTNETVVAPLYITSQADTAGGAGCSFGCEVDNYGQVLPTLIKHPALGYSIDAFLETFDVPFPTHIKVDIDGIQEKVILGAKKTLRDPHLKTVMIELQRNNIPMGKKANDIILKELEDAGFCCVKIAPATPNITDDRETSVTNNFFERRQTPSKTVT